MRDFQSSQSKQIVFARASRGKWEISEVFNKENKVITEVSKHIVNVCFHCFCLTASFRGENVSNTSQVFVSSTRPTLSPVTYNLQPSPTASYALQPAMMQRTVPHNTASVSVDGRIATIVSDKAPPCGNSTNCTGLETLFF